MLCEGGLHGHSSFLVTVFLLRFQYLPELTSTLAVHPVQLEVRFLLSVME